MRETLVKEGIQDRLANLIGDGSSTYSAQQSMKDDMKRIHYAILGNSDYGRVMAGMSVSLIDSNKIAVDSGYGITIGGNLIKFGKQYSSTDTVSKVEGNKYYVYVNYEVAERDNTQGGQLGTILNASAPEPIIKDQIGASGEDEGTTALITVSDAASASISVTDTKLYVATIQFVTINGTLTMVVTRDNDNDGVSYTYSKDVTSIIWSTTATYSGNRTDSIVALDSGRNRLKELNIIRLNKSTNAARTASTTDYYVRVNVEGLLANGLVGQVLASDLELQDMINTDFDAVRFSIEDIILDNVVALRISTAITYTGVTAGDFDLDYDAPARISYVIERLT